MSESGPIKFFKDHGKEILERLASAAVRIPPNMNTRDLRWLLGGLFSRILCSPYEEGTLRELPEKGHDIIFGDIDKISIKSQKCIFQTRNKLRKGYVLTNPQQITMKNGHGRQDDQPNLALIDYDYLLAIQRGDPQKPGPLRVRFGIISAENLNSGTCEGIIPVSMGEQTGVTIKNDSWDYLSKEYEARQPRQPIGSQLNHTLAEGIAKLYNDILAHPVENQHVVRLLGDNSF